MQNLQPPTQPAARPGRSAPPPLPVRIGQGLRFVLKKTVWNALSTFVKNRGRPLETVQVLVVDRALGKVLCLATAEGNAGYTPVQGLRKARMDWFGLRLVYSDEPARDAFRELAEEALEAESAEGLAGRLELATRYWEGANRQFDCRVYRADGDSRQLRLKPENAEGLPLWLDLAEARRVFGEPLRTLLKDAPAD